jgi:hypothetical protein
MPENPNTVYTTEPVESLRDHENATVTLGSYKKRNKMLPMFIINENSPYPFSFGLVKAKLILKFVSQLRKFVETDGRTLN